MNIEHKKTALSDDSDFYNKDKDTVKKEDLKNLSFKQKIQYFMDYHFKTVLAAGGILIFVIILLNTTIFNRKETVMTVAYLNDRGINNTEKLEEDLRAYLEIERKNDLVGSSYYNTDEYSMNMAFYTHTAAGGVDLIICSKYYFLKNAENGMLYDLSEYLPDDLYKKMEKSMLTAQKVDETDENGNAISYYEEKPYGIDISNNSYYEELGGNDSDNLILCIAAGSVNKDNTIKLISALAQ